MKKTLTTTLLSMALLLVSPVSKATVISFDNTTDSFTSYSLAGSYTESGFTITRLVLTGIVTVDSTYSANYPSYNGTDFFYFTGSVKSVTFSMASPFSLQSFVAANLASQPAGTLTLTGHLSGGGTLTEVFSTLDSNQWSLFSLTGWNDLTSVDAVSQGLVLALDDITINQPANAPEPSVLSLVAAAFVGFRYFRQGNKMT